MKKKGKDPRVHGIKGASALLEIENFDMIKAFVPGKIFRYDLTK